MDCYCEVLVAMTWWAFGLSFKWLATFLNCVCYSSHYRPLPCSGAHFHCSKPDRPAPSAVYWSAAKVHSSLLCCLNAFYPLMSLEVSQVIIHPPSSFSGYNLFGLGLVEVHFSGYIIAS